MLAGCGTTMLPPRLTQDEADAIKGVHFPYTVGVRRFIHPAYSKSLLEALQASELFDRVDYVENYTNTPDLLAVVDRTYTTHPCVPFLWLLSFGAVPEGCEERYGNIFSFVGDDTNNAVHVDFRLTGYSILGWLALPMNLLPDWTLSDPEKHPRYHQQFSLHVVDKQSEIRQLVAESQADRRLP